MHGRDGGRPVRTGRYSRHAPFRLAERIESALADPELVSMREQFAVLDALAIRRIEQLESEDSPPKWGLVLMMIADLPGVFGKLRESFGPLVSQEMAQAFEALTKWHQDLEAACTAGQLAHSAEADLRLIFQEQSNLAKVEIRREQALTESVTSRQLQTLVAMLLDAITRHVTDADARRAIQRDIIRAIGPGPGGGSSSGGSAEPAAVDA